MRALLLVLLAATALTAWYWSRFPGRWVFTFSAMYADERAQLTQSRQALRELDKAAAQTEKSARDRAAAEDAKYRRDVQNLEHEIEGLLHPGLGRHLKGPIGDITLYTHGVKMAGRTTAIPLADLKVEFRSGPTHIIDLVEPSRRTHRAKYPLRRTPGDEETPFFTEEQLGDFAVEIQNAAADEDEFRAHRKVRLPRARQELESAQQNTESRDAALKNLKRVCAQQKRDPRRQAALAELEAQRDRWQELTGRRPPR
ncbi:hypothetical protein PUR34_13015 [Streptomyces sp. JV185]|uniref:hypothetical protein n=1 Tax=Streptomyces sp. JV185 TaxID=858638 RepID=UPI002E78F8E8|nr:hypothetical protein [Streptomyces sp. JV185]MEE1769047.1 hypothetical protein [Streptomyces sp. JV185]